MSFELADMPLILAISIGLGVAYIVLIGPRGSTLRQIFTCPKPSTTPQTVQNKTTTNEIVVQAHSHIVSRNPTWHIKERDPGASF